METNLQCRVIQVCIECDGVHLYPQERDGPNADPDQTKVGVGTLEGTRMVFGKVMEVLGSH